MRFAFYAPAEDPAPIVSIVDYPDAAAASAHAAAEGLAFVEAASGAVGTHVVAAGVVAPRQASAAELEAELIAAAKNARKARRAEGAEVALPSGATVHVDAQPEDVSSLTAAWVRSEAGLTTFPRGWKGGGAFYSLQSPADLEALAVAVEALVQGAYDAEAAALAAIAAGTATTVAEVQAAFDAAL